MSELFITYHANKKNGKTYYALLRNIPVFGSDDNYVVYQNKEGDLFARKTAEFSVKFRKLSPDDRPSVPGRKIKELTKLVVDTANSNGFSSSNSFSLCHPDTLAVVYENVIDCTNQYSNRERMLILFYDVTTETFWLAETKTPRVTIKEQNRTSASKIDVLKYLVIDDIKKVPVFARPRECEHVLGKITRLDNNKETLMFNSKEYNLNMLNLSNKQPIALALKVFEESKKSSICKYEFYTECPLCRAPLAIEHKIWTAKDFIRLDHHPEYTDEFPKNAHTTYTEQRLRIWNLALYLIDEKKVDVHPKRNMQPTVGGK